MSSLPMPSHFLLRNNHSLNCASKFQKFYSRVSSFSFRMIKGQCKVWIFQSLYALVAIGSVLIFFLAMACAYLYVFPYTSTLVYKHGMSNSSDSISECNVFEGSWIQEDSYPLYNASQCPFAERGFNCISNGRRDRGYMKWRWKPKNCDLLWFSAREALEGLRGKRVVFVGDSLSRTQWESFICMLMTGLEDKTSVREINGNKITKQIRFLSVEFGTFNLRVDFYRSVFLVQPASSPKHAPKRVKSTIKLDKLDFISKEWIDADVLVFNSGHWWTPTKLFATGCYFQVDGALKLGMPITSAFKIALETWASWVDTTINSNRTRVYFRTFESSHWRNHKPCTVTKRPSSLTGGRDRSSISDAILGVAKKMKVPVRVLHVTPMGAFRSDGHVGTWSDNPSVPDCSHWCLPGVPDTWNEILFSYILSENQVPFNEH
ncbi:protein trichome berefringence-like 7 isoform X1 [Tripterygium wilfordii]|uniref:protein trichome berefringence-like 7 isoform X1 n=1 Tax=Tripterygium wilfordii TaxID=458696 RepID=UPI0018F84CB2|nr:protein trichome berefringence-like 7 isoform X1 [Tripterygium wilfordii]